MYQLLKRLLMGKKDPDSHCTVVYNRYTTELVAMKERKKVS